MGQQAYRLLVIMWFLFGEVSSFSGAWDGLRYFIVALLSLPYNYFFINTYITFGT